MAKRYFEDFTVGEALPLPAAIRSSRAEIIAFAAEFDPQPFHLDERAAATDHDRRAVRLGLACLRRSSCACSATASCSSSSSHGLAGHRDAEMAAAGPPRRPAHRHVDRDRDPRARRAGPEMGIVRFRHEV